jgi:hypothetical protein
MAEPTPAGQQDALSPGSAGRTRHKARRRRRPSIVVLVPLALLASSAVVYQASNAAFSAQTANGTNNWASGSVTISDDDSGNAIVNLSNLKPGDTATKCINVTYTGSLSATVKLYTSASTDSGLGQYLDFSVDEGTGATGGATLDCTGFTLGSALYPAGTLGGAGGFITVKNSYTNGVSTWAPAGGSNATKSYRFVWTLQDNNSAQNKSSSATFTWEARNS